uniref:Uncharacterized protein n=1 Tax=Alexandrium catenella TaxID=2925 RepID=A0A7S1MRN2_ALECA
MEREMAQVLREVQAGAGEIGAEASRQAVLPGTAGGVRGHVSRDTPMAFANGGEAPATSLWDDEGAGAALPPPPAETQPARPHWTGFADAGGAEFGGSPLGKVGGGGSSPFFGGDLSSPPSFSHLGGSGGGASPGGAGGPFPGGTGGLGGADGGFGVTEWSGTLRDFKAGSSGASHTGGFL